jgi:undecaprenyl-diphosphatase
METIQNWDQSSVITLNNYFSSHFIFINKFCSEYLIYLIPILLIVLWFVIKTENSRKAALRALFSIILAWPIIAYIIGNIINRPRPFNTVGVQEIVFHRPDYSFPSDHAAALFAFATSLYLSDFKKLSYLMFIVAILVSFFRIADGIHFPTDIIAGAGIGIASAIAVYLLDKYMDKIYNFIIKIAKQIKLA